MSDLKNRLSALLSTEPNAPDDLDHIVMRGRRAHRRRVAVTTVAGGAGAAALTASVVVPISFAHGSGNTPPPVGVAHGGSPRPQTSSQKGCTLIRGQIRDRASSPGTFAVGRHGHVRGVSDQTLKKILAAEHGKHRKTRVLYCLVPGSQQPSPSPSPTPTSTSSHARGYTYTTSPQQISARLGAELTRRVKAFGLTITYTRPFAQESSTLAPGHPDYFGGNVDVRETHGYGDVGVQVTHRSTHQPALRGPCHSSGPSRCRQTTLPDGSILRTGRVPAGAGDLILTAEVSRPDGVLVQAQESDYAFGPQAGSEPHGSQPLTLGRLTSLAEDADFTF